MSGSCQVCGQPTRLSCPCSLADYCSSACQKSDWPKHKASCPPVAVRAAGDGRGVGVFATRAINPGQIIWSERPLISYKKDPRQDPETFIDSLYKIFCGLNEATKAKFLKLYDPGEEAGKTELKWKVCRICNVNEVGGQNMQNSVYERYSRLNHACCRNAVGQVAEQGGCHQVRAIRKIGKGEEVMVAYLEGRLGTREEKQAMFMRKWGFRCDCRICKLPDPESSKNDATIRYIREMQVKISQGKFGAKSGLSHTASLQQLHTLLASCYKVEDQDHSVLRCVLVAILHGLRKLGENKETDGSSISICPNDVIKDLENRLGSKFWADPSNYEKEAMRVASLFGQAKQMLEYMT